MTSGLITSLTKKAEELLSEWNHKIIFCIFNKTRKIQLNKNKSEQKRSFKPFEQIQCSYDRSKNVKCSLYGKIGIIIYLVHSID